MLEQLQQRREDEAHARDRFLRNGYLQLDEGSMIWISNHIDCFVSASRGNEIVEEVHLYPHTFNGDDDGVWNEVGQAVGNLQALERLGINTPNYDDDDEVVPIFDWKILARILSHVRQRITLNVTQASGCRAEDIQLFARAIRGHPTVTGFIGGEAVPYESSDVLYSALATLPALESVILSSPQEDESTMARHESLTELLRVPSLRSVCFSNFNFTPAFCQATANAFMEGTAVTKLSFWNSISAVDLSPVFLALGNNIGLKTLVVGGFGSMDESLCTAMQNGLGMNETLESLELNPGNINDVDLWSRALSFLRTNKALKSFKVDVTFRATQACLSAFRIDIAAMLQENTSLESLSVLGWENIKAEDYVALVTTLQHNMTLKTLSFLSWTARREANGQDSQEKLRIRTSSRF